MTNKFVTRFAPSPTGNLHLGHAYSALLAHDLARAANGIFLLRIEDIDQGRCRPAYEEQILEDLSWLGIEWDAAPVRQSDHMETYRKRLDELIDRGLVYRCFRTRREVENILSAPHRDPDTPFVAEPLPAKKEKELLDVGQPFAWRLSQRAVADAGLGKGLTWTEKTDNGPHHHPADFQSFGDVILARKDVATSYHIASVHDDHAAAITDVVRGDDLRTTAHLHRLLIEIFGMTPVKYTHHRLINGDDGKRLAKRDKAKTLRALRETGIPPARVRELIGLPTDGSSPA